MISAEVIRRFRRAGIDAADVEERFIRGSGPGGQKINKTSSTVVLRHRPTGIEVRCQDQRSQAANRESAWRELAARVEARAAAEKQARESAREVERRRNRPRSRRQKTLLVESKRRQARKKSERRGGWE